MKFKVFMDGIGLKEVEAEEIDDVYAVAIKQFGCRLEDILAVGTCVTVGEYLKRRVASRTFERTKSCILFACAKKM